MGLSFVTEKLRSSFFTDVLSLSFGTLAGRLIALAALPIVTRLYSPADFGVLAVYTAIVSIISVAACLRFDVAIALAETDEDAANLLVLSLISLSIVVLFSFLLALIPTEYLNKWLESNQVADLLWLFPIGIALSGSYSAFRYWSTRHYRFRQVARTRVTQAIFGTFVMLFLGWNDFAPAGLLIGFAINSGSGSLRLAVSAWKNEYKKLKAVSINSLRRSLARYHRFPVFSTWEALLDYAGAQVPVLLIAAYANIEAGFLLLAMQVMSMPIALIGSSISQVYMSRASEALREGKLTSLTYLIMKRLFLLGLAPLAIAFVVAPSIFPLIFGDGWVRSGEIVRWISPWVFLQFIAGPVSMILHTVNRQDLAMGLHIAGLVLRAGIVFWALNFFPDLLVPLFAVSSAAFYLLYIYVIICTAKRYGAK